MAKRVVILGGGAAGVVASWVFRERGADVTVIEPGQLGGEFVRPGGLRYIHFTERTERMVESLGLPYSDFIVEGGILLRGKVHPYPGLFAEMGEEEARAIQRDHYIKTRRAAPEDDPFAAQAMNAPKAGAQRAIRCDFTDLFAGLAAGLKVVKAKAKEVKRGRVFLEGGGEVPFDLCVVTLPLWVLRGMVRWYVPEATCVRLNVAIVTPHGRDPYLAWDYVYTPYTPEGCVHRISHYEDGYMVEFNGEPDRTKLEGDLNFLFPTGHSVKFVRTGLNGHLLPLSAPPAWPQTIQPLGRFASWNPRATLDVVLDDAVKLAERWLK